MIVRDDCWIHMTFFTLLAVAVPANADEPIAKIFAEWRHRRQTFSSVRYDLKGIRAWPKGSFNEDAALVPPGQSPEPDNPDRAASGPIRRNVLLDLQRNRFRIDFEDSRYDSRSRQVYNSHCLCTGDGQVNFTRVFEDSLPGLNKGRAKPYVDLEIRRGDPDIIPPSIFGSGYEPLFFGQGVVPPRGVYMRPTNLAPQLDPTGFTYHGRGAYDGQECFIIRNGNKEYWVDLSKQGAIVKFIANPDQKLLMQIEYQQAAQGWLPKSWVMTVSKASVPWLIESITVEDLDPHPTTSDDQFRVAPEPGMYVNEVTIVRPDQPTGDLQSKNRYYRVEPEGQILELNEGLYPIDGLHEKHRRLLVISPLALPALVVLFAVAWTRYKARKRQAP